MFNLIGLKKVLGILLITFYFINIKAQNNQWIDMFSYAKVNQIFPGNDKIFAVSEYSIFSYDPTDGEIEKFSSINGLKGDEIAQIYYDSENKNLFIIYINGWIQIMDEQKKILSIPDLYLNTYIPEIKKRCNALFAKDSVLYLAMDYGVSEFDLKNNEFGDTYFIGNGGDQLPVNDILVKDNYIYAATSEGLKKANKNNLLIDASNWPTILDGNWLFIENSNNQLAGVRDKDFYKINPDESLSLIYHSSIDILDLRANNNYFSVTLSNSIHIYDESFVNIKNAWMPTNISKKFKTGIVNNEYIYGGTDKSGIIKFNIESSSNEVILPDGPSYNDPFGIDANENHIWVVYGKHSTSFNPYPLLSREVDHYNGTSWTHIPYSLIQARSLSYVRMNPSDPNIAYISSGHDGLIKIENDTEITHYDETNSSLDYFIASGDKNIRVFGIDFDDENNLFISQTGTGQPIKILKNDGNWSELHFDQGFFNPDIYTEGIRKLQGKDNYLWFGTVYKGVIGYDLKNDTYVSLKKGIDPIDYTNIQSLSLDYNDRLWAGNHRMLRYLDQPESVFANSNVEFQPVKIEFEGSVQLLLEGQSITRIQTDGNNNKWIATAGSGIYYISEDGKNVIYHFTKTNSPLPSDEIYDLAVDNKAGIVYFATSKGLVGYHSKVFSPADNLKDVYAFPNPVIMQKHNEVTIKGLIKGVNVKIIDVEGNLVYEEISKGGSITWNLSAFGHHKVSSGVYIALITNEDGTQTQTTKILIIK